MLTVQEYSLFAWRAMLNLFRPPVYWTDFLMQSDIIGVGSLPIVILSGFFTGGVLALQSAATLSEFGATAVTGQFVRLTMIRELGPVLTGIMVAGRNASSMASELGSMVVTEQIDAMRALGVDPMRKLVTPRIFASIAMLLLLTIVADAFGILGGAAVTVFINHQNGTQYFNMAYEHLRLSRHHSGTGQAALLRLHPRLHRLLLRHEDHRRHRGRGPLDDSAVVNSSVLIIFVDFLITHVLALRLPHMSHASAPAPQSPAPSQTRVLWSTLRDVSIAFDGPPVLEDISFSVAPGETRILLGPAGVGKSVLLKLIIGLLRPQAGTIHLFGEDISHMPEEKLFPCARAPAWFSRKARSSIRSPCATTWPTS